MKAISHLVLFIFLNVSLNAQWITNGTIVSTTGSVGIGTTSPTGRLSITAANSTPLSIAGNNSSFIGSDISISRSSTLSGVGQSPSIQFNDGSNANGAWIMQGSNAGGLQFFSYQSGWYEKMRLTYDGSLGIGTSSPATKLHLAGDNFMTIGDYSSSSGSKGIVFTGWRDVTPNFLGASIVADPSWLCCSGYPTGGYAGTKSVDLHFNVHDPNNWATNATITAMSITSYGNVGIGTKNPQSLLAVNGTITTRKVVVTETGWSDYVFEPTYKLRSLQSVETFIKANKHLPDVPSAADVAKNGVDVSNTQATLLRKIEELTLYTIDQDKLQKQTMAQVAAQNKIIAAQQDMLVELRKEVNELKAAKK